MGYTVINRGCLFITVAVLLGFVPRAHAGQTPRRPNVILIITDDMGHGDLGVHGNPIIKTPHLDRFAKQSVRMQRFFVSPVCSPTRSSLLTGRYNYRTGVVDTFIGRSMMHPDEVTLAELLAAIGYRTGIFGKWHLGDNYPLRAMDQGFHEALVLKGGGIGQPSDPPGGESYFDPVLQHNGKQVRKKGYCSDVFTDAAMDFIAKNRDGPFFCYLAFNAPHTPLQIPERYHQMYAKVNLAHDQFPKIGQPLVGKVNFDDTAKVYGMVTNIDDNLGRLFAKLEELNLAENTIVIFLTDNGPQQVRYNSGMRMRKGSVHEGGVRVPFFVRWPAQLPKDRDVDRIAAHIDIVPTLRAACGVPQHPVSQLLLDKDLAKHRVDGVNLLPLWKGQEIAWPDRTLYVQWHRGDVPQLHRACAARSQKWRLVQPEGAGEKPLPAKFRFQLYDMDKDPYEQHDVADQHSDVVASMKAGYETWFKDVSSTRGYDPPRIHVGSDKEPVSVLTRQDWRGPKAGWGPKSVGHWEIEVARAGKYEIKTIAPAGTSKGIATLIHEIRTVSVPVMDGESKMIDVQLPAGPLRLEITIRDGADELGPRFVELRRTD
jgi:arylsulfatase A-like enzyme